MRRPAQVSATVAALAVTPSSEEAHHLLCNLFLTIVLQVCFSYFVSLISLQVGAPPHARSCAVALPHTRRAPGRRGAIVEAHAHCCAAERYLAQPDYPVNSPTTRATASDRRRRRTLMLAPSATACSASSDVSYRQRRRSSAPRPYCGVHDHGKHCSSACTPRQRRRLRPGRMGRRAKS